MVLFVNYHKNSPLLIDWNINIISSVVSRWPEYSQIVFIEESFADEPVWVETGINLPTNTSRVIRYFTPFNRRQITQEGLSLIQTRQLCTRTEQQEMLLKIVLSELTWRRPVYRCLINASTQIKRNSFFTGRTAPETGPLVITWICRKRSIACHHRRAKGLKLQLS